MREAARFPQDWYWRRDSGAVFSSAKSALVPDDDAAYVAWLAAGLFPTVWPRDDAGAQTDAALASVLRPYGLWPDDGSNGDQAAITLKSDIFRRCTDDEAEQIEGALAAAPARMRRLFESVQTLSSDAEEYGMLRDTAIQLFGEARADELLAPSAI